MIIIISNSAASEVGQVELVLDQTTTSLFITRKESLRAEVWTQDRSCGCSSHEDSTVQPHENKALMGVSHHIQKHNPSATSHPEITPTSDFISFWFTEFNPNPNSVTSLSLQG